MAIQQDNTTRKQIEDAIKEFSPRLLLIQASLMIMSEIPSELLCANTRKYFGFRIDTYYDSFRARQREIESAGRLERDLAYRTNSLGISKHSGNDGGTILNR